MLIFVLLHSFTVLTNVKAWALHTHVAYASDWFLARATNDASVLHPRFLHLNFTQLFDLVLQI